jgi:outer membrane protein assembly factor BamB
MNMQTTQPAARPPLRLWPGVAAAVLLLVVRFVVPAVVPDAAVIGSLGAVVGAVLILVWWLFFSRAPWSERIGALVLMIVALYLTRPFVHESIRGGFMGMMLPMFLGLPGLSVALVVWAAATRQLSTPARRAALVAATVMTCALFTLIRTDGITGGGASQVTWRWTPTAEERLLKEARVEPIAPAPPAVVPATSATAPASADEKTATDHPASAAAPASAPAAVKATDDRRLPGAADAAPATPLPAPMSVAWAGFRGPNRDGVVRGAPLATDWSASPPARLWQRAIGPGWSSFAVGGNLLYTQEQRGEHEIVACYKASTGEPVWIHRDAVRFYESNGGAGPRGTPTLSSGRVYSVGATAIVNALDARTGAVVWTRNASADTGAKLPGWGFTSSPVAVNGMIIVAASGRLIAYDAATGQPRWKGPVGRGGSYSSPQVVTIANVPQILLLSASGATSVAIADGTTLWTDDWPGVPIVQPNLTGDGDVLITTSDSMGGLGTRRLAVSHGTGGWKVEERWTSNALKPYFNDYVVHKGYAYGFDGNILACIDLADGKRRWKGGRYGNGQIVLLPDQDLLLVLSEEGELALVKATADQFTEVAGKIPAIEGKTWNHPVLVGDTLFVRNGQEMAAFRLPANR